MDNKLKDLVRIGIFYDGYYFYKVSNYYKYQHAKKARISIAGLHNFVRSEVANISGTDITDCQIVDAHYFKGRSTGRQMGDKVQFERMFEDILMRENIITHYLPLRYGQDNKLQEKGIDVWLALEAYELASYKRFDILVLVACDGDYVPLVRKLSTLGIHVILLSWDFEFTNDYGYVEHTSTSRPLQQEAYLSISMDQRINEAEGLNSNGQVIKPGEGLPEEEAPRDSDDTEPVNYVKNLFVEEREYIPSGPSQNPNYRYSGASTYNYTIGNNNGGYNGSNYNSGNNYNGGNR
jgi:uncharacterized LabA/DUF88 family protein